jgi:signal recognition particle GTPase
MSEKLNQQVNSIVERIAKGKQAYDLLLDTIKIEIDGHTIEHWKEKFWFKIPTSNITPAILRDLDMKLMELLQEVSFHSALADARKQMSQHGRDTAFNTKYAELYKAAQEENSKRAPAAMTLDSLARDFNEDLEGAIVHADIATKFWKNILEHLSNCRRLLENASMNLSVELKALNNEHYMDILNKKNGGNY